MRVPVGFYREAWLVVAQGGWWKRAEILERLPSGVEVDDPYNRLWVMERRHNYLQSRGAGRNREYAVTDQCVIPHGIPVKRLTQALHGVA